VQRLTFPHRKINITACPDSDWEESESVQHFTFDARFSQKAAVMATDEQQEIDRLCLAVIREKDATILTELVAELNKLLERRERKLDGPKSE
jgi:hypothetical protein